MPCTDTLIQEVVVQLWTVKKIKEKNSCLIKKKAYLQLVSFEVSSLVCREQRSGNTLYQELSFQDNDNMGDLEDGPEVTGNPIVKVQVKFLILSYIPF